MWALTCAAGRGVSLYAQCVNDVGELGWELHTPMAEMPMVFEALKRAGETLGLTLFGTYVMNSLRIEKTYHAWGAELTNEVVALATSDGTHRQHPRRPHRHTQSVELAAAVMLTSSLKLAARVTVRLLTAPIPHGLREERSSGLADAASD